MEQPKKPGGARDITDLKARLGLNKGAPAPSAPPGGTAPRAPFPGAAPTPGYPAPSAPGAPTPPPGSRSAYGAPAPFGGAVPMPPGMAAPAAAPLPEHDPYAAMRPPAGRQFDLRPVDDGVPTQNVKSGLAKGILVGALIAAAFGLFVGYSFGVVTVGNQNYNSANKAAKLIRREVDEIQKTTSQISAAIQQSNQRIAAEHKAPFSYDPKLVEQLASLTLDPRPSTATIFRADYARLEDLAVDQLMSYYYDSISLYGEVERFVRKTKSDKASLEAFAVKQDKSGTNYGVVFDSSRGKLVIGNLVELGQPVCKGGGNECTPDKVEKLEVRMSSGAPWSARKVGAKPDLDTVVPIEKTPLLEAAFSGSPDQARMEQYRQRLGNMMVTLQRLAQVQKPLVDLLDKASQRPDRMSF